MGIDPVFLFHGLAGLCIAIHTKWQRCNEQINFAAVSCNLIIKGERGSCPVHHKLVTRFVLDMHRQLILCDIILIQFTVLGVAIGRLAGIPAGIYILLP